MDTTHPTAKDRLLVHSAPEGDCLIWTGAQSPNGYGLIKVSGRMHTAHRIAYGEFVGPVPPQFRVRQTCGNRLCINPDHLEMFTESFDPDLLKALARTRERDRKRRARATETPEQLAARRRDARRRYRRKVAETRVKKSIRASSYAGSVS